MNKSDVPFYEKLLSTLTQTALGTQRDDQLTDNVRKSWRRRIGGALLLGMYAIVFYTVIMSLTAYQIQTRVRVINDDGNRQSVWSIARIANEVLTREKLLDDKLVDLSLNEFDRAEAEKAVLDAKQKNLAADGELVALLARLDPPIVVPVDAPDSVLLEAATKGETDPESGDRIRSLREELLRQAAAQRNSQATKELADKEIARLRQEVDILKGQKKAYEQNTPNFGQIADVIDELRFFRSALRDGGNGFVFSISEFLFGSSKVDEGKPSGYMFVTLPSEVLIMLVVITMGTMGSMISITQTFFAGEDRPLTFYLFRPLLGAIVAIGVYVITKAGVIVSSNLPLQADGAAELNAFFVSFISLVAGLMSESAINTIRRAGTGFLRGDPVTEKARYASQVDATMTAKKKKAKDLYPFFDVTSDVVDKWLAETEQVPGDAQRIIAAWLGEPVRNLFSDLPPDRRTSAG